ncbi:hypothetical protein EG328_007114 [Venturia inaequalis]|uniref:BTB domain-containing protein n=1 Tax=Venturia inaequalis TaxID=5025 RepID=A0A8H3YT42_VENIN|nr:hypothetical protein EG328_007114 [Venturia inaequalis]
MKVAIDPDGDVLLVVGSNKSQVSLQVSSKVLSVASKMFKTMFFGQFKEAVELANSTTPYEVLVPDDEPVAMIALCSVLHHVEFTPDLSVLNLSDFAGVADKYDAVKACKLAGKAWLDHIYLQIYGMSGFLLIRLLNVSYIFDDYQKFKNISKMVLAHPDGCQHVRDFIPDAVGFPDSVPDTFATLRRDLEDIISERLMDPVTVMARGRKWYGITDHTSNKGGLSSCKHDVAKSYDYTWELTELGLWPITPRKWNLDTVIQSLAAFKGWTTAQNGVQLLNSFGAKCSACSCNTVDRMETLKSAHSNTVAFWYMHNTQLAKFFIISSSQQVSTTAFHYSNTIVKLNSMTEPQAKRLKLATPGNVVVDPDGDVLLLIGTDNSNPELSIQVSSKVLSVASKVFRAMFSRNFREALSSMPVKIPLPDDNPDAILTLCKVLHFDTADLATTHDIAKLQGFAVVADKYDCVLACIFYGRVWLTLFWEDSCALPEILALAYLFDDPHTFKKVSATLLLSGDGVDAIRKFQKTTSIMFPVDVCGKSHHFSLFTSSFINGQIDALAKKRSNMEQMEPLDSTEMFPRS